MSREDRERTAAGAGTEHPLPHGGSLVVRPAADADARALAHLWEEAFPAGPSAEKRLGDLVRGEPYGGLETSWVGEVDGELAGAFRAYSFHIRLFGRRYPVLGLGAVAVRPDFRRRGVGRLLCQEGLRLGRERGDALALLYPFRPAYYARLQFTLVGELHRYRFPPGALPPFPDWRRVRQLGEGERGALEEFYGRAAERTHGLLERSPAMWTEVVGGARRVYGVVREDGSVAGYLVGEPLAHRSRHAGGPRLHVRELLAEENEVYQALLGWISQQRDQWDEVIYDAVPGENLHRILDVPARPGGRFGRGLWFESARVLRGPMARIIDVEETVGRALGEGQALPVADEELPGNSGLWERRGGEVRRAGSPAGEGAEGFPISVVTELFLSGTLPGQGDRMGDWDPLLGLDDFRLLNEF